jgi:alpha-L-arabinofuranosidase
LPAPRGLSESQRIVYQAAEGEKVIIKGSEIVKAWIKIQDDVWKAVLPNSMFGDFNPFGDLVSGDWFLPKNRQHHTGAVYLDGEWLREAATLDEVLAPAGDFPLWFAQVDKEFTTVWAQFKGVDPNASEVEVNVRQTVFTPAKTGIDYIVVRGFDMRHAATPWAPPTAKQIGVVSALWCKGWIIEDNEISYSKCSGVALGKYGDEWDNTSADTAEGYVSTIHRALSNGWNKATIGSHTVRNNHIHHCEQVGIVGSMGCSFSTVTGNLIHDIHTTCLFGGYETGGIKFHGAIDTIISRNHIHGCGNFSGIWLDWMCQGAQVTCNLMHDNSGRHGDLFLEMQHGPLLVANNLFLSTCSSQIVSKGIAFAHNLFTTPIKHQRFDERVTPFHHPHSTELAGMREGDGGDHRFYNNILTAKNSLTKLEEAILPSFAAGNVFVNEAVPSKFDVEALLKPGFDCGLKLTEEPDGWYLAVSQDTSWRCEVNRKLVTTARLGKTIASSLAYDDLDGSELRIATDYFGKKRDEMNPFPGPFEDVTNGSRMIKVWVN